MLYCVLNSREKSLGLHHTSTLNTVHNLGILYANQNKLKEAKHMLLRALVRFQILLRPFYQKCEIVIKAIKSLSINTCNRIFLRRSFTKSSADILEPVSFGTPHVASKLFP
jgi:hypothetical protein